MKATKTEGRSFPDQRKDHLFLTEGGIETEIMYKWGFEIPHFAMFPLLENSAAVAAMRGMYHRYLDVAAKHGMSALMGGLDYRASPDWGELLGYSRKGLAEANLQSINFLRALAREYATDFPATLIQGFVGPRGDAYQINREITVQEAEDYHSVQLMTLKEADVDLAWAFTFNNIPEAIGVARAADRIGVPLAISLTLDSTSKLGSGPTLAEAIERIEAETKGSPILLPDSRYHSAKSAGSTRGVAMPRSVEGQSSRVRALCRGHQNTSVGRLG